MRCAVLAIVLTVITSTSALAADEITVEKSTVGCQANRWTLVGTFDAGEAISVSSIDNDWTAIRVRSTSSLAEIGAITLTGVRTTAEPLEVAIAGVDCLPIDSSVPIFSEAGTSWSGLTFTSGSESLRHNTRLVAAISANLSGSVTANHLGPTAAPTDPDDGFLVHGDLDGAIALSGHYRL